MIVKKKSLEVNLTFLILSSIPTGGEKSTILCKKITSL